MNNPASSPRPGTLARPMLLLLAMGTAPALAATADLVSQITAASYQSVLQSLPTGGSSNRGFGPAHDIAQTQISSAFQSSGLTTTLNPFTYNSATYYNVIGVKTGAVRPEDVYIIGAHYDSVNNPGADDDGSGVAAVLEAAALMGARTYEATVIFAAFDREEQGLIGSAAYAAAYAAANPGKQIKGMLQLDMIAYDGGAPNQAAIYGRTTSDPWKNALVAAMVLYGGSISGTVGGDMPYSDHHSFEANGYMAAVLIEADWGSNPYYHTQNDSVDTPNYIDYAFGANMTRAAVGLLSDSAVEVSLQAVPEPLTFLLAGAGLLVIFCRRARAARLP
jgi:Zn-dependent M28 family amino/carboxypeptidase